MSLSSCVLGHMAIILDICTKIFYCNCSNLFLSWVVFVTFFFVSVFNRGIAGSHQT